MAGICFHIEADDVGAHSYRKTDLEAWNNVALAAGDIDTIAIVNRTTEPPISPDSAIGLCLYANLGLFLDDHRGRSMVYVCAPWDSTEACVPLWRFDHDIDWYVFGPAGGWDREIDTGLTVPQSGRTALPSVLIASAVLLHRHWVKRGGTA